MLLLEKEKKKKEMIALCIVTRKYLQGTIWDTANCQTCMNIFSSKIIFMWHIFSSKIIIIWARLYIKEILESYTPNYYPWLSWDKGCSHVELWVDFLLHVSILESFHNEYVKCFQSEEKDINFMKLLEILTVLGSSYIAPTMCQEPFWVLYIY